MPTAYIINRGLCTDNKHSSLHFGQRVATGKKPAIPLIIYAERHPQVVRAPKRHFADINLYYAELIFKTNLLY
jgi:hypothetical protein